MGRDPLLGRLQRGGELKGHAIRVLERYARNAERWQAGDVAVLHAALLEGLDRRLQLRPAGDREAQMVQAAAEAVEDQEKQTEPANVTYLSDYVRRERPRGRMRWETKNPGPTEGRGSNPCLLVVLTDPCLNVVDNSVEADDGVDAPESSRYEPPPGHRRTRVTARLRAEVVSLYGQGRTSREAAEICGIAKSTVLGILKKAGVDVRLQGRRY